MIKSRWKLLVRYPEGKRTSFRAKTRKTARAYANVAKQAGLQVKIVDTKQRE